MGSVGCLTVAELTFNVKTDGIEALRDKMRVACTVAENILAWQIKADTEPYVPADTLSLTTRTEVRYNNIIYPGPYARYLYYGKYMVDESGHGPRHYVDSNGNEVIRYPKGSHLHATDKDLVFSQKVHGQAQSHWFEASKAENLDKWKRVVAKAIGEKTHDGN